MYKTIVQALGSKSNAGGASYLFPFMARETGHLRRVAKSLLVRTWKTVDVPEGAAFNGNRKWLLQ